MPISTRTKSFKKSSFPYCINEWNNLKADIRNAKSISMFKKLIVSKKHENSLFSVYDPLGEKFLTRLRFKFSHLKEHKFRHGFADTINPKCLLRFTSCKKTSLYDQHIRHIYGICHSKKSTLSHVASTPLLLLATP